MLVNVPLDLVWFWVLVMFSLLWWRIEHEFTGDSDRRILVTFEPLVNFTLLSALLLAWSFIDTYLSSISLSGGFSIGKVDRSLVLILWYFKPFSKSTPHINLLRYSVSLLDQLFGTKLTGKSLLDKISQLTIGLKDLWGLVSFYAFRINVIFYHFYLLKRIFACVDLG